MAYAGMIYLVMADIVMASCSYGLYSDGLCSYGLYSHGLHCYALYCYSLYCYGLSSYGLLPRNANIRASLPEPRTLTTYGPQASRTGTVLRGPLGPVGMKESRQFSFFLEQAAKTIFVKVPRISPKHSRTLALGLRPGGAACLQTS